MSTPSFPALPSKLRVKELVKGNFSFSLNQDAENAKYDGLSEQARMYVANARSENTRLAYTHDLIDFFHWCVRQQVTPCPATPATIVNYLTYLADVRRYKASTMERRMAAISQMHKSNSHESPTSDTLVREAWKGIKRNPAVEVTRTGKSPLLIEEIRQIASHLSHKGDLKSLRDRTLIVIGFAGAFRRSELVALNVEDIDQVAEGLVITIRKSKTDQEGQSRKIHVPYGSRIETCPARTYMEWIQKSGITSGPIFRRMDVKHRVLATRLSDRAVARIVKDAAQMLGLMSSRYAGHSLRSGFITSAVQGGARPDRIMAISGHRSHAIMQGYIRDASGFKDNAATYIGL